MTTAPTPPPAVDAMTGAPVPIDRTRYHVILGDGLAIHNRKQPAVQR